MGSQSTKAQTQHREDRTDQLCAIALDLFTKKGFDATSVDSIATAAGVSKRTPYLYFKNKHDLFSAVVLRFLLELEKELESAWRSSDPAIDRLRAATCAYATYAIRNPTHFRLIMTFERRDFYPGRKARLPANARACQDTNDRITQELYKAIDCAKEEGNLRTDLDARQFGLLFWSSLTGVISIALERKSLLPDVYGWTAEEMIHACIDKFFNPS